MEINENKTKVVYIGKGEEKAMTININGKLIKQMNQFKFLGSVISRDAKCINNIQQRMLKPRLCSLRGKSYYHETLNWKQGGEY